ncbi:MAG: 4Fe-4S dicluster domain-containing protein [Ignavibacteriae bacterium]|nr:4Fe-4S dicluster domain-containing protein [Ignavibacteriota bacterium]
MNPVIDTYKHSIYFEPTRCTGEMDCLKVCPVESIRVRNGKARMLEDKCIDCGECVKICRTGAIIPLTNTFKDFSKFEYTIVIPSLALYTQFDRHIKPKTILSSLKKTGFNEVVDITRACISVLRTIGKYVKDYKGRKPLISSFCPTCVKIIQMRYPELIENLIPVISPMGLAAKEAKREASVRLEIEESNIGVIYITPCPSKTVIISKKTEKYYSAFDGAIPVSEIYNTLYDAIQKTARSKDDDFEYFDISGFGLNFARLGGLGFMMNCDNCITVSGINNVLFILDEIEKGKLHNVDFVEMHGCTEACLGGPMNIENVYLSRTNLHNLINYYSESKIPFGKKDKYESYNLICENMFEPEFKDDISIDIKKALSKRSERKKIYSVLPKINCGACGSPTCETFAEDAVEGEVSLTDCIMLANKNLEEKLKNSEFGMAGE